MNSVGTWIAVIERLPESANVPVLAWLHFSRSWRKVFYYPKVGRWEDYKDGTTIFSDAVSHWCAIRPPEPPQ